MLPEHAIMLQREQITQRSIQHVLCVTVCTLCKNNTCWVEHSAHSKVLLGMTMLMTDKKKRV